MVNDECGHDTSWTASRVDELAVSLALESRSLLGLPDDAPSCSSGSWIQTLARPPSALEFARHVNRHQPLLIEGCIQSRRCWSAWQSSEYIVDRMAEQRVQIALTPNGKADDICWNESIGKGVFALPLEQKMTLKELFDALQNDQSPDIAYLQSQNSNLTASNSVPENEAGDFSALLEDVCTLKDASRTKSASGSYEWADEALDCEPEATNLWIGTEKSTTSMHRDHYENLFSVIRGTKIFTLYPPCEAHFLCEGEPYEVYQWARDPQTGEYTMIPSDSPPTPWIPIDPSEPSSSERNRRFPLFSKALAPLVVEVQAGQTLYLPAGWYHHVAQRGDATDGVCVCVNWWYDSAFAFSDRWALEQFVKDVGALSRGAEPTT